MESPISFGAIADLQYCDAEPQLNRYFRNAPQKLQSAIKEFNCHKLDFIINLGDTIDHNWRSYDGILPHFKKANAPLYYVLGNHDYEIEDNYKVRVPDKIGIKRYYDFIVNQWRFIVLDGNEISTFANLPGSKNYVLADKWLEDLDKDQRINANFWNGGIGHEQLEWLETRLSLANQKKEMVVVFCHFPIFPEHRHNLLNDKELLEIITKYDCFKIWINGHNHDGNYGMFKDKHIVNLKGMADTEFESAYSIFQLYDDHIRIHGFGNEISARLVLR